MKQRNDKKTPHTQPARSLDDQQLKAILGGSDSGGDSVRNGRNGRDHWDV